ncbi:hypothetical protein IWW52_006316 [Coemansia sp. RSA 2704]|nr:hypothetical protein IWW52_006316 [Coemansia sp. RSA 2704]
MHTLSYAINFWSKGQMSALFLRHEGFLGATGAFFKTERDASRTPDTPALELAPDTAAAAAVEPPRRRRLSSRGRRAKAYSFTENFSIAGAIANEAVGALGMLDREPSLLPLPQLVNTPGRPYQPDTVDLSQQPQQQEYWISAMERNTNGLLDLAESGALPGCESADARQRLSGFVALYLKHLQRLRERPLAYGAMSVRALLGLREQCLHEVGLEDIFAGVKRRETDAALAALPALLRQADAQPSTEARARLLLHNVLAGNMFDWGSTELRGALAAGALDLERARAKITWRPQFDNTEQFVARVTRGPRFGRAVVFVDNSGADVCLGVLPFARFLLQQGTQVVLAANSRPALNDVTERELAEIVERTGQVDLDLRTALEAGALLVCGTGSSGPCLDLRKLDARLVQQCQSVDLVVIVGMGRAIHSNYHASFSCESLKLAVFKNQMAADAANAQIYDALCMYAPALKSI